MKYGFFIRFLILACLLSGCIGRRASSTEASPPQPVPTINPLLAKPDENTPSFVDAIPSGEITLVPISNTSSNTTSTPVPPSIPTPTANLMTPTASLAATPTPEPTGIITDTIYNGNVNGSWILQTSSGLTYKLQSFSQTYPATSALAVSPKVSGSILLFLVRQYARSQYLHSQVYGVTFWLNSGNNTINPGDLTLTILGSDQYPYYDPNDRSADSQFLLTKSGTRLYDLGFNRSIPPNTWVQVFIKLSDLVYDPGVQPTPVTDTDYKYITGFFLRNEGTVLQTFYITQVGILLLH